MKQILSVNSFPSVHQHTLRGLNSKTAKEFLEKGYMVGLTNLGALCIETCTKGGHDTELDEILVEIDAPPKGEQELILTSIVFSIWAGATNASDYFYLTPAAQRWVRMAVALMERPEIATLATRTFTMQVREEEGILISFNKFNR